LTERRTKLDFLLHVAASGSLAAENFHIERSAGKGEMIEADVKKPGLRRELQRLARPLRAPRQASAASFDAAEASILTIVCVAAPSAPTSSKSP
jgi:hypothetical protein